MEKLVQVYDRVSSIYSLDMKVERKKIEDGMNKRQKKLADTRKNIPNYIQNKAVDVAQGWIADRFSEILKEIVEEHVKALGKPPPVPYAIIQLGNLARREGTPSSRVEYAIVVEVSVLCTPLFRPAHQGWPASYRASPQRCASTSRACRR